MWNRIVRKLCSCFAEFRNIFVYWSPRLSGFKILPHPQATANYALSHFFYFVSILKQNKLLILVWNVSVIAVTCSTVTFLVYNFRIYLQGNICHFLNSSEGCSVQFFDKKMTKYVFFSAIVYFICTIKIGRQLQNSKVRRFPYCKRPCSKACPGVILVDFNKLGDNWRRN